MSDSEDEGGEYILLLNISSRIGIELALLDPDQYWECGSGSRNKEIDQNLQINLIFNHSKWYLYLYFRIFYDILST